MPIKTIKGDPFNIIVEGKTDGPVLLFSNSLSSNLSMWDAQAEVLKTDFRVIRYDSRGHGKSIAIGAPYSLAQLGQDALAILDALKIEKAHFCGLSKGGMVGQWSVRFSLNNDVEWITLDCFDRHHEASLRVWFEA